MPGCHWFGVFGSPLFTLSRWTQSQRQTSCAGLQAEAQVFCATGLPCKPAPSKAPPALAVFV